MTNTNKKSLFKFCTLILLLIAANPAVASTRIKGEVVDEQNEPIIGATVLVYSDTSTVTGVATNLEGQFDLLIKNVPFESLHIRVSSVGHEPVSRKVDSLPNRGMIRIVLPENLAIVRGISVRPERETLSHNVIIGREEIAKRAQQSFIPTNPIASIRQPLITRQGTSQSSRIRVGGTSPQYYLNGTNIGTDPDHYGVFSVIPASVLKNIKFQPLGSDARYGSPSVLEMNSISSFKPGRKSEMSFSVLEVTASGSISSREQFLVGSLRQSLLDKLAKQLNVHSNRTVIPPTSFQDLFVSFGRRLSPNWQISVDQLAVRDYLAYNTGSVAGSGTVNTEQQTSQILTTAHSRGVYNNLLLESNFSFRSASERYNAIDNKNPEGIYLDLESKRSELQTDHHVTLLGNSTEIMFGTQWQFVLDRTTSLSQQNWNFQPPFANTDNPYIYQSALNQEYGDYYAKRNEINSSQYFSTRFIGEKRELTIGTRLDNYSSLDHGFILSFRTRLLLNLTENNSLTFFAGSFAENPSGNILEPYQALVQASLTQLRPITSYLYSASFDRGNFSLSLYKKSIKNLPSPTPDFERVSGGNYKISPGFLTMKPEGTSDFSGAAFSIDIPKILTSRLSGYTSYAYTHAHKMEGSVTVPNDLEAPHRFVGRLNYEPSSVLSIGAQLDARSGYPYSPLRTGQFSNAADAFTEQYYQSQLSAENSLRFPTHVQLNVNASLDFGNTNVFMSIANITNRANPIVNSASGLIHDTGILPSFGVTYKF